MNPTQYQKNSGLMVSPRFKLLADNSTGLKTISEKNELNGRGSQVLDEENKTKQTIVFPRRAWIILISFLTSQEIVFKIVNLDKRVRNLTQSLNCTLFETFLKSYGLPKKISQSDVYSSLDVVSFLKKLERNSITFMKKKVKVNKTHEEYLEKRAKLDLLSKT